MEQKHEYSKLNSRLNLLITLLFIACVSLLLYPYVSNLLTSAGQTETFVSYDSRTHELTVAQKQKLLSDALSYNERLAANPVGYSMEEALTEEYMSLLDMGDNGLMAIIEIPCIKLRLPVYHTVKEEILQIGAGHVQGSSLPVEGCDSNVMLMAHRGLPNAELFNNLDRVSEGETFTVTVLNTALRYEVKETATVKPDDVAKIGITKNRQLCTLVTCTPYGVNSDRLVVTGELTDSEELSDTGGLGGYSYTLPFSRKGGPTTEEILALAGLALLLMTVLRGAYYLTKRRRKHREKEA